jgi:hypothetical protein
MRRYLVFPGDFDARALTLEEPGEHWDEVPKKLHAENRQRLLQHLQYELGPMNFESKVQNFKDAGSTPFSIIAYHNDLFYQVKYAFIHGYYYPSLVGSCALGERILNHLILDLRDFFKSSPLYKDVYRKDSFDDWEVAITVLDNWGVFQVPDVSVDFRALAAMRHKAIHFNPATVTNLRSEALSALRCLANIITKQFGFAGGQKWLLTGTRGNFFIKKSCETDPFLQTYYLPQCPYVGPYYAMKYTEKGWYVFDRDSYPDDEISDEEFARLYESRTPEMLVSTELPPCEGVQLVVPGKH